MMGLMDRFKQDEVAKQKAAAFDEMMRKQEIIDSYNRGGQDAVSAQAAQMYANDLVNGLAGRVSDAEKTAWVRDNLPTQEEPRMPIPQEARPPRQLTPEEDAWMQENLPVEERAPTPEELGLAAMIRG